MLQYLEIGPLQMGSGYGEVIRVGPNAMGQVCLQEDKKHEHRHTTRTRLPCEGPDAYMDEETT